MTPRLMFTVVSVVAALVIGATWYGVVGVALVLLGGVAGLMAYARLDPATRAARAELAAARRALDALPKRREEDEAYWAANARVIEAERPLRWWQRIDIEVTS